MKTPLVTCIVPTYNRPPLALRALRSVLRQSYTNIEIIVVDDSTNDDTERLVRVENPSLKYMRTGGGKGAPHARNLGISEAKGDAIAFLDDDDEWMPHKIEMQLQYLTEYRIVTCNYISRGNGGDKRVRHPVRIPLGMQLHYNYIGSCSFVLTEVNILRNCGFDEMLTVGQDWDLWISLMRKYDIGQAYCCQDYLTIYNCGGHSRISLAEREGKIPSLVTIYQKHRDVYDEKTLRLYLLKSIIWPGQPFLARLCLRYVAMKIEGRSILREYLRKYFPKNAVRKIAEHYK